MNWLQEQAGRGTGLEEKGLSQAHYVEQLEASKNRPVASLLHMSRLTRVCLLLSRMPNLPSSLLCLSFSLDELVVT